MDNQSELQTKHTNHVRGFLVGLLVGSLAGAVVMLLFVPQSGKQTQTQIQEKGIALREQTTGAIEDALAQTNQKADQIKTSIYDLAETLQQRGQDVLDAQKER
jgi:gas vesicle protein